MRNLIAGTVVLAVAAAVQAQSPPAPASSAAESSGTVSREEYNRLKQEQEAMRKEMDELKRMLAERPAAPAVVTPATGTPAPPTSVPAAVPTGSPPPTGEDFDDLQRQVKGFKDQLEAARPGTSSLVIAGDMDVGFNATHGSKSTFEAGFAPLILYQPTQRVLIEAAADIGIETLDDNTSDTTFDLTIADVSFLVNDNLAIGGGLFVVPFGVYHNHFDPPWINKFPDDPLPFADGGIAPGSEVGIFARGAVPVRSMKIVYDAYVTNGPNLVTNNGDAAGSLNFEDYTDLNDNKAVGGRLGWLPLPNLEMGYSLQFAEVQPSDFPTTDALLQAVDVNYRQQCDYLKGVFDVRAEWAVSDVGTATFDPDGKLGFGPVRFDNYRQGGYVQLCYRPTLSESKVLRNFELVSRYDWLIQPLNAPGGDHEKRTTLGVDYWFTSSVVLKAAYQFGDRKVGPNNNAFMLQLGIGF